MSMLPVDQQLEKYQGILNQAPDAVSLNLGDKLGLIASSLARGQGRGLGFGESIGLAAGDLGSQVRQIDAYNRNLSRQNLMDQLGLTKVQADLEQQKRQEAFQKQQFEAQQANARAQLAVSQGNLGLQREEFNAKRDAMKSQQAQLEQYIGMLPPEQQALARIAPEQFVSGIAKNGGMLGGANPNGQPSVKPSVESEKARTLGQSVLQSLDGIDKFYFDNPEQTNVNRSAIFNTKTGGGRDANQRMSQAIQNILYLKSGASATQDEINRTLDNYAPSLLDTPEQVKQKLSALRSFANSAIPGYAKGNSNVVDFNSLP